MKQEELKYKSLKEFKKAHYIEYNYLTRNKLLDKLCEDMGWIRNNYKSSYWTKELCIEDAKNFEYINDWRTSSSYGYAYKHNIISICVSHMKGPNSKRPHLNFEYCLRNAKKCSTYKKWYCKNYLNHYHSFTIAKRMGWVDNIKNIVFTSKGIIRKEFKKDVLEFWYWVQD